MNNKITTSLSHWAFVAPLLQCPNNESDYQTLVEALDAVLDAGGVDETHSLASLADFLGNLIEEYEAEHHPV